MLTIIEVAEKSGEKLHTIQYWRQLALLPEPVAVKKRVIFFDEGILQRIAWIRKKQAEGMSLNAIKTTLESTSIASAPSSLHSAETREEVIARLKEEMARIEVQKAALEIGHSEYNSFVEKWQGPNCKEEICKVLGLDPVLTGDPLPRVTVLPEKQEEEILFFKVYATITSDKTVYFAEIDADVYKYPLLVRKESIDAETYGMLLYMLGAFQAKINRPFHANMVPFYLFTGYADGLFNFEKAVKVARSFLQAIEMGQEFHKFIKKYEE